MARATVVAIASLAICLGACTSAPDGPMDGRGRATTATGPVAAPTELRMLQPRAVHHATTLHDGRVLFTGGCTAPGCGGFDQARRTEFYDPAQQTFSPGPEMLEASASGTATLLSDGRVLLAGGYPAEGVAPTGATELYDPATDRFLAAPTMTSPRADQTATLMPDGRVLIAGGYDARGVALDTTEFYDPQSGEFSIGPRLSEPRAAQSAIALGGDVVLVGGTRSGRALRSTDVFDGSTWTSGPNLLTGRVKLGCAALPGRQILVVGGATSVEGREKLASTEIVSLRTARSRYGPNLSEGEYKLDGAVVGMSDGRIAIAGGHRIDLYDPRTDAITTLGRPELGRRSFISANAIGADSLLVAGGYDDDIVPTDRAWIILL